MESNRRVVAVILLSTLLSLSVSDGAKHPCERKCMTGQNQLCRFNFTVQWYRTLSKACYSCPFNITDCYREACVAADGKVRAVLAINKQIPGPAINVCEGDEVEVAVTNMLEDGLATSMHWHGQHVNGAPYFDGAGGVTQCNIQQQETFVYNFKAYPAGTHWYHSHTGMQFADGAYGALIVRQPQNKDPNEALYDEDLPQHTIFLHDWLPELSMPRYLQLMYVFDGSLPRTAMVNGRARKFNVTDVYGVLDTQNRTHAQTPLEVLRVEKDKKYRLRFISSAPACPFQVSVDEHQLTVISVDGIPVIPRVLDAFIIHPGERYDFVLDTSKNVDNYWLRIIGIGDCWNNVANGVAIVRYTGAPDVDPSGDPDVPRDGILLNPILYDSPVPMFGYNRTVIATDALQDIHNTNYTDEVVHYKHFVGIDYNNNDNTKYNDKDLYPVQNLPDRMLHLTPVMDNITFALPPVPLLSERQDFDTVNFCNRSTLVNPEHCLSEDLCICTHVLHFPLHKVVELIVFHEGRFFEEIGHTMHLHGYSFRLMGLGKLGPSVSRSQLEALEARGELKRNYISPHYRDTVNVPDGGYAILRFTTDNPGFWFFHCHTDGHLQQGMALLIRVGEHSDLPPIPKQFPRCGGMGYSNADRRRDPCPTSSASVTQLFLSTLQTTVIITFIFNYIP